MKQLLFIISVILISFTTSAQTFITDSNFDVMINKGSAFENDNNGIVIVEFWVDFNKDNAFKDFKSIKNVTYYRMDIANSTKIKAKYKVRMAPTLIVFKDGVVQHTYKAKLDLLCPVNLKQIQSLINELTVESKF